MRILEYPPVWGDYLWIKVGAACQMRTEGSAANEVIPIKEMQMY